jgi:hypothetical protein
MEHYYVLSLSISSSEKNVGIPNSDGQQNSNMNVQSLKRVGRLRIRLEMRRATNDLRRLFPNGSGQQV